MRSASAQPLLQRSEAQRSAVASQRKGARIRALFPSADRTRAGPGRQVAALVAMTRKLLGLAVSYALFPKPITLAHAAGAALVFGAGTAHALLRSPPKPARAAADAEAGRPGAEVELLPQGDSRA